ncbi:MAG TPA: hypothetical protein VF057_08885 [Thermoanaerobaculia bacterium]
MRPAAILMLALLSGAPAASPAKAEAAKPTPEELVEAAKEAKSKRKRPSSKVITNADVKKSKGTLIELPASSTPGPEATVPSFVQRDIAYRERLELEAKISAAEAKLATIEKELQDLEYLYYAENNPDRRDHVIRKRFEEKQKEFESARDELAKLTPKSEEPAAQSEVESPIQ